MQGSSLGWQRCQEQRRLCYNAVLLSCHQQALYTGHGWCANANGLWVDGRGHRKRARVCKVFKATCNCILVFKLSPARVMTTVLVTSQVSVCVTNLTASPKSLFKAKPATLLSSRVYQTLLVDSPRCCAGFSSSSLCIILLCLYSTQYLLCTKNLLLGTSSCNL